MKYAGERPVLEAGFCRSCGDVLECRHGRAKQPDQPLAEGPIAGSESDSKPRRPHPATPDPREDD